MGVTVKRRDAARTREAAGRRSYWRGPVNAYEHILLILLAYYTDGVQGKTRNVRLGKRIGVWKLKLSQPLAGRSLGRELRWPISCLAARSYGW